GVTMTQHHDHRRQVLDKYRHAQKARQSNRRHPFPDINRQDQKPGRKTNLVKNVHRPHGAATHLTNIDPLP
ncbi:MAG: hypothetical protein V3R92_04185, partial [Dehalococcoidales bacterium]